MTTLGRTPDFNLKNHDIEETNPIYTTSIFNNISSLEINTPPPENFSGLLINQPGQLTNFICEVEAKNNVLGRVRFYDTSNNPPLTSDRYLFGILLGDNHERHELTFNNPLNFDLGLGVICTNVSGAVSSNLTAIQTTFNYIVKN